MEHIIHDNNILFSSTTCYNQFLHVCKNHLEIKTFDRVWSNVYDLLLCQSLKKGKPYLNHDS
jgi:hypothetical protein